jgi:hypothetical protein
MSLAELEVLERATRSRPVCPVRMPRRRNRVGTDKALTPTDFIGTWQPVVVEARLIFDPRQFRHRLGFCAVGLGDGASLMESPANRDVRERAQNRLMRLRA